MSPLKRPEGWSRFVVYFSEASLQVKLQRCIVHEFPEKKAGILPKLLNLGGGFKPVFMFNLYLGKRSTLTHAYFFRMGWFNHQLAYTLELNSVIQVLPRLGGAMGSRVAITGAFSYSGFWGWWFRRGSVFFAEIQVAFGGEVLRNQCNVVDAFMKQY